MRTIIVGGVAGGMSAATRLRRLNNETEIIVLDRSKHVSYANCGLPYYLGGIIEDEGQLLLQTPETLHERFRLDVRVQSEVSGIDTIARIVRIKDLQNGESYELSYDNLILSPGAVPVIPDIPGIEHAFSLRTVEDVESMAAVLSGKPEKVVVIGGGFIGVEIAENLVHLGISVTIIESTNQVLAPLDPEMAIPVAHELQKHGVSIHFGASVKAITDAEVILENGEHLRADAVIVSIGVRPDVAVARTAGIMIGSRGGIVTDEYFATSAEHVFAIGDAAEKIDALDGESTLIPLANIANRQGRIVADHICGREVRPCLSIGTAVVKVFDVTVAVTGWNEKKLASKGRSFVSIHTHPYSHASYYPGSEAMSLKVIVDPETGAILGAQGFGGEGVDKRIDVLATAIRARLTAPELADLELAYAPQYGSAKDPINMIGYIADNVLSGLEQTIQWSEIGTYLDQGVQLVDVRTAAEYAQGSIPGALNIPVDELRERIEELDVAFTIVMCHAGQRAHVAARLLNELDIPAANLDGGYATWLNSPAFSRPTLTNTEEQEHVFV